MLSELKNRTFIIFAMDHYNPLGLVRSLGRGGGKSGCHRTEE